MSRGDSDDRLMSHEYDGIEEYDNPMPRWWVWIFVGTSVFAAIYFVFYHMGGPGSSNSDSYALEMKIWNEQQAALAMAGGAVDEATLNTLMADTTTLAAGKATFAAKCVSCHGERGEGKIGPNLTDDHWIHGAKMMDVYRTIDQGIPDKGMPAWGRAMKPDELKQVVAYVGSIRWKHEQGGRAPEGEKIGPMAQN
jgi:cytochrome c oxidase cbb3-type subunit 3